MTVITIVLSNSTSATGGAASVVGYVQDFDVVLPKALVVRGHKCRLLEFTCVQESSATGRLLLAVEIPFLSENCVTGASSNASAAAASATNIAFDKERVHAGTILLTAMDRVAHTVFPPGHDYDLSQTTIPKHFVVKVRSGVDGTTAVEIRYLVLKFAMDVVNV